MHSELETWHMNCIHLDHLHITTLTVQKIQKFCLKLSDYHSLSTKSVIFVLNFLSHPITSMSFKNKFGTQLIRVRSSRVTKRQVLSFLKSWMDFYMQGKKVKSINIDSINFCSLIPLAFFLYAFWTFVCNMCFYCMV